MLSCLLDIISNVSNNVKTQKKKINFVQGSSGFDLVIS